MRHNSSSVLQQSTKARHFYASTHTLAHGGRQRDISDIHGRRSELLPGIVNPLPTHSHHNRRFRFGWTTANPKTDTLLHPFQVKAMRDCSSYTTQLMDVASGETIMLDTSADFRFLQIYTGSKVNVYSSVHLMRGGGALDAIAQDDQISMFALDAHLERLGCPSL